MPYLVSHTRLIGSVPAAEASSGGNSGAAPAQAHFPPEQIIAFAEKVEKAMVAQGARVAILARIGRPVAEMPPGIRFTHVAFAVYSEITEQDGRTLSTYVTHNLYQLENAPDKSELTQDFPVDFFATACELEAGIIVPSTELQQRLLKLIATPDYASLHKPSYSVIANPYHQGWQNCTGFVLDVVSAAIYQTIDPEVLKANLKSHFEAQTVDVSPVKLKLGSLFMKEISLADQNGTPITTTFESIGRFLQKVDEGSVVLTIQPD